jgi:pyruvate-ferredoxin/flavodoxin oxidoreductase
VINAQKIASDIGMGGRINTVMQTSFFAISGVLPKEEAITQIKKSIRKSYGKRGEAVVKRNFQAVDETLAHLYEVKIPVEVGAGHIPATRTVMATQQRTSKVLAMLTMRPTVPADITSFSGSRSI